MLVLRSLFFALLLPGTVTLVIPYSILAPQGPITVPRWAVPQFMGSLLIGAGAAVLIRCIVDFARVGRGTLAPVDAPRQLVVRGLYRYVRNPMYVGVLSILLGEAALFQSAPLIMYAVIWLLVVNLFVIFYEEPALRRQFGESYEHYRRSVGRWIPGRMK